jgi:hypothetical protein
MGINAPVRKEGTFDKIAKGMGLANSAIGIVGGIQGIRKSSAEMDALDAKNDPMKRRYDSALKPKEQADLQDKGFTMAPVGTKGATSYSAIGPKGELQEIGLIPPKFVDDPGLKTPKNRDGDALAVEDREVVTKLAGSNANKIAIANQIESVITGSEGLDDTKKLQQYRQLIKVLNSTQGQDAVGAEEARRLASKLEIGMGGLVSGNLGQFGRDLPGFAEDAAITVDSLRGASDANDKEINSRYASVGIQKPMRAKAAPMYAAKDKKPSELVPGAVAGGQKAPKGKVKVSNGKETFFIDPSDVAGAMKDKFKVVE